MAATLLSVDFSDALLSLLQARATRVDAVEVGPWFTPRQIRSYREVLPGTPFHFHAADLIENIGVTPNWKKQFKAYLNCTQSPWISLHISVWKPGDMQKMKNGQRLPLPPEVQSLQSLIDKISALGEYLKMPLLIENVEPLPFAGYDFWAQPDFIRRVIEQTGSGLLVDTGHARISAEALEMDVYQYVQLLPLESLVQVHVSGPRRIGSRLCDVHEFLQEEDYELLEYLLSKSHPKVVTLEYIQEASALRMQLDRLQELIRKPE